MSTHAIEPTALGTFFTYPLDAAGAVAPYWRDAGGEHVRMTGACKRAFLATVEALIERAVIPANFGNVPASVNNLASATYGGGGGVAPFSLIDLRTWATASGRNAIGPLLRRGLPYGVWSELVNRVWSLFRITSWDSGSARVIAWQWDLVDSSSGGYLEYNDPFWSTIYSLDWSSAEACDTSGVSARVLPWGPWMGSVGGSAVIDAIQGMFDGIMANVTIGGGSGNLKFAEDALAVSPPVMLMNGVSLGNWFTNSASTPVGGVTVRRSAAAWGVLQAMLAQMKCTHLLFPFSIDYEHTDELRVVERVVSWDADEMDWTCEEISDTTTESTTVQSNRIDNKCGYGPGGGLAAEVFLDFELDNNDPDAKSELALASPPADVGPDGPYAVIGRAFLPFCTVSSVYPEVWSKSANRMRVTDVDHVQVYVDDYPAPALLSYVHEYGKVHFADSLYYKNQDEDEEWTKYRLSNTAGSNDLESIISGYAYGLMSSVPGTGFPPISAFNASIFRAGVSSYWSGMTAVYPTSPNCTVNGHAMYFPVGIYGYQNRLYHITLDSTDNSWKGTIRLGYGDYLSVFPLDGGVPVEYAAWVSPWALAGYKWQFKAMPTTSQ